MNFYSRTLTYLVVGALIVSSWTLFADNPKRSAEGLYKPSSAADRDGGETDQTSGLDDNDLDDNDQEVEKPFVPPTTKELRKKLSRIQYDVTQNEATEPAFRNPYWNNKKPGVYKCVVCDRELFSSRTKYMSGTGWPSFFAPISTKNVAYKTDWNLFYSRTEVHCSRCKAHLGHVFDDGPQPTGKRFCMNSASLKFVESKPESESDKDK